MSNLTNIMDDSVYLARDYSSIVKWFANKLPYLTTNWTDLSVSEPDTLSLSMIAYMYDLTNYLVDRKFIKTTVSKTDSVSFLSDLYKLVGDALKDYESGLITADFENRSNDTYKINQLDIIRMKTHPNELFTCIESVEVQPKITSVVRLVRGVPVHSNIKKVQLVNGYTVLSDNNINRNIIIVKADGVTDIPQCEDAIFENTPAFSITQVGKDQTAIRLSPTANKLVKDFILVIYTINDEYPLAENSDLVLLNDPDGSYTFRSNKAVNLNQITLYEQKLDYYKSLKRVDVLYNDNYDVSQLCEGRIDYITYEYVNTSMFLYGSMNYMTGQLTMHFDSYPLSRVKISYRITNSSGDRLDLAEEFSVTDYNLEYQVEMYENYHIEPGSIVITVDDLIINDSQGNGELKLIKDQSYLRFKYSTTDDNPIIPLLDSGSIDYVSGAIELNLTYLPSTDISIKYDYSTSNGSTCSRKEYFSISELTTYIALTLQSGEEVIQSSVVIENGDNIIKDKNGQFYNYQSDKSVLIDKVTNSILLNEDSSEIDLVKLGIRKVDIRAKVFLYNSDVNTSTIYDDIVNTLTRDYKKGTHDPGETIKRLSILLSLEGSNPNIKYVSLEYPQLDVAVDSNQIADIGSINISFERSDD